MNKPRGDSKLKTLAPDKQALIIGWLNTGTKEAAKARIERELGVKTNGASLSEFYNWWNITRRLEKANSFTETSVSAMAANPALKLNKQQLAEAGQIIFELKAMEDNDTESYVALRKLRQQEELLEVNKGKLEIDQRKMELLEAAAKRASEAETVVRSTMTPEEQRERLKQIFGM